MASTRSRRPVAAAPPPPVIAPKPAEPPSYEPRDPLFMLFAGGAFYGALLPSGATPLLIHDADRDQAEDTADALAIVLDGGEAPAGYIAPEFARLLEHVGRSEVLRSVPNNIPGARVEQMTEAQRGRELAILEVVAKDLPEHKIPDRAEVMEQNKALLDSIATISEPVRSATTFATVARLSAMPHITGARLTDAMGVLVETLEGVRRLAQRYGVPLTESEKNGDALPYPGNAAFGAAVAVTEAALRAAGIVTETEGAGEPPIAEAAPPAEKR